MYKHARVEQHIEESLQKVANVFEDKTRNESRRFYLTNRTRLFPFMCNS